MAGALIRPARGDAVALETALLVEALYRQYGVDFRDFEPRRVELKLEGLIENAGIESISALQGRLLRDPMLARETIALVSDSRSDFFTVPSSFMALRCAVLPLLRSSSWPVIWVADCSDPAFVIQLTVMLEEEGLLRRTQVYVTNPNGDILDEVARLEIGADALHEYDERHMKGGGTRPLGEYLAPDGDGYTLRPALRENLVWSQHDLTGDASFRECHLVVCSRPMADFDVPLQGRALQLFSESLCNFGILQVQAPPGAAAVGSAREFSCVLGQQGIYKRLPRRLGRD